MYERENNQRWNYSVRKAILTNIYVAQLASDSGKGIFKLPSNVRGGERAVAEGYPAKYSSLRDAERLIKQNPNCGISFAKTIIQQNAGQLLSHTFTIARRGEPSLRISFHTPVPIRKGHKLRAESGGDYLNRNVSWKILELIRTCQ